MCARFYWGGKENPVRAAIGWPKINHGIKSAFPPQDRDGDDRGDDEQKSPMK